MIIVSYSKYMVQLYQGCYYLHCMTDELVNYSEMKPGWFIMECCECLLCAMWSLFYTCHLCMFLSFYDLHLYIDQEVLLTLGFMKILHEPWIIYSTLSEILNTHTLAFRSHEQNDIESRKWRLERKWWTVKSNLSYFHSLFTAKINIIWYEITDRSIIWT